MDFSSAGFVLHRRPYREDSALVDIYTEEQGRWRLVAHGLGRKRQPTGPLLQPFQPLLLQWRSGVELGRLKQVELHDAALVLQRDALFAGYYLNELLLRLLPVALAEPELYQNYVATLQQLTMVDSLEPLLREFELQLLDVLGYGVPGYDCYGEPLEPSRYYRWLPDQGWMNAADGVRGDLVLLILERCWQPDVLAAGKQLCRMMLHPLLGPAPLRSRQLWLQMKKRNK